MKTKWDALFAVFALKRARLGAIAKRSGSSPSSTRQKLIVLIREGLVQENASAEYLPNKKNPKVWNAFNIMKFCRNRKINYNMFFSEEFAQLARIGMEKETVLLSDFRGMNCKTARKYLTRLNRINLVFVVSKKPLKVRFVREPVFDEVLAFFGMEKKGKPEMDGEARKRKKKDAGKGGGGIGGEEMSGKRNECSEIDALLKEAEKLQKNAPFADLDEEAKIEFTSASTQLEGNTFTLEESKQLILNDVVPQDKKLKEANEVKNYFNALNYMIRRIDEPVSIDFIVDLHRIVVHDLGVREGIRSANVSIKGNPFYKAAHFSQILPLLDELCKKINEFNDLQRGLSAPEGAVSASSLQRFDAEGVKFCRDATRQRFENRSSPREARGIRVKRFSNEGKKRNSKEIVEFATFVHNEFQHIHPFEDGNSRMTRLLWNYVLIRNGFPLMNVYANAKEEYLSLTKLARERDDARLNEFFVGMIKDNLYKRVRGGGVDGAS